MSGLGRQLLSTRTTTSWSIGGNACTGKPDARQVLAYNCLRRFNHLLASTAQNTTDTERDADHQLRRGQRRGLEDPLQRRPINHSRLQDERQADRRDHQLVGKDAGLKQRIPRRANCHRVAHLSQRQDGEDDRPPMGLIGRSVAPVPIAHRERNDAHQQTDPSDIPRHAATQDLFTGRMRRPVHRVTFGFLHRQGQPRQSVRDQIDP